MKDRKKKHRILTAAGIVHCAGWIAKTDEPAFDKLVAKAADDVKSALSNEKGE